MVADFGATVVFCTATQPYLKPEWLTGLQPVEIVPEPQKLFDALKRVEINREGALSDAALAERLRNKSRALVIVNTRAHALSLYGRVKEGVPEDAVFHLSALMCPKHRSEIIEIIRVRLKDKKPCIVVSTQLIEAGVDIDFPVVYRAEAGLESIAQSAGRCNREGAPTPGRFYIFTPEDARIPPYLEENANFGREVLKYTSQEMLRAHFGVFQSTQFSRTATF
ncbi:hypothetical protein FACS1894211_04890 [Clostridia bacterium]|nr:hypothetical protein FACS1894211_04890 [Clostridia bacterium]